MIFISKDARALWCTYIAQPAQTQDAWQFAFLAERLTMRFDPRACIALLDAAWSNAHELLYRPPTRPDALDFDLAPYEETYRYVCGEYVVHDYGRVDALRLAALARDYPTEAVRRVGERCRANDHFEIAYLAAALESEGAKVVDTIRRENRINELIASSSATPLPPHRFPGKFQAALENARTQDEIKKIARGHR